MTNKKVIKAAEEGARDRVKSLIEPVHEDKKKTRSTSEVQEKLYGKGNK